MPWHRASYALHCPANAISGRAYRGLNVLTLWVEGEAKGYSSGQWATYRQWSEHGAQVRKGERGTTVFFWQQRPGDRPTDSAEQEPRCQSAFNRDPLSACKRDPSAVVRIG
jgi:antirestriction protein ArdC